MDLFADAVVEAARLLLAGGAAVWHTVLLSFWVSGAGLLVGTLVGIPIGVAVALRRFRGRQLAIAVIHTGFALPPVVIGLFVYMVLSRSGPLGILQLLYTPTAMIIAQSILAAPYIAGITLAAVQAVPADVRLQARALGASPAQALLAHLREARLGLVAAIVGGFGAVISEVGAVMTVGGNLVGETRVMTTAIVLETRRGNFGIALAFGVLLLAVAFLVNLLLTRLQQGGASRRSPAIVGTTTPGRPWS